jgi:hypothetical protein
MIVISVLGQSLDAILAYAEVALLIIVDPSIEDGGVHAADIANVL